MRVLIIKRPGLRSTSGGSSVFSQVNPRGLGVGRQRVGSAEGAVRTIVIFIVEERIELLFAGGRWRIPIARLLVPVVRRIRLGYEADKVVAHRRRDGFERRMVTEIRAGSEEAANVRTSCYKRPRDRRRVLGRQPASVSRCKDAKPPRARQWGMCVTSLCRQNLAECTLIL